MFASQWTEATPVATSHLSAVGTAEATPSQLVHNGLGGVNKLWSPKHRRLTQDAGAVTRDNALWAKQRQQLNEAGGSRKTHADTEAHWGLWRMDRVRLAHEFDGQQRRALQQLPVAMATEEHHVLDAVAELLSTIEGQGQQCEENLRGVVAPPSGKNSRVDALDFDETLHGDDNTHCNLLSLPSIMKVRRLHMCSLATCNPCTTMSSSFSRSWSTAQGCRI
jgi:hypothetical protein